MTTPTDTDRETPLRVAVAGAAGYGGGEMLRWLADHPRFDVCAVSSRRNEGKAVARVHPQLFGTYADLPFVATAEELADTGPDAVVLALPHGAAAAHAHTLDRIAPDARIVDLSGDHRLRHPLDYAAHYHREHPHPEALTSGEWVYGLTEANREQIRGARKVANPGCFATGAMLGMLPLVRMRPDGENEPPLGETVRHVAITGSSGSGADAKRGTHHPERVENVRAYKVLAHQHVPEIVVHLADHGMRAGTRWRMVPLSGPFARGISTTLFVELDREIDEEALRTALAQTYADSPLAVVRTDAQNVGTPQIGRVRNTAHFEIALYVDGAEVVVLTAIDNLCKGMVTQAIQNLNLMFDLPEATGLLRPGGRP